MDPFVVVDTGKLERCTHCGFCLPTCPTYAELGQEMDSPRGRIYLIQALKKGRLDPTPEVIAPLYRCLECRACETACPSGVPFGPLMEEARAALRQVEARPRLQELLADWIFRRVLPYPRTVARMVGWLAWYQRLGLSALVRQTPLGKLLGRLGRMEALLPQIPPRRLRRPLPRQIPAEDERRYRVGFLSGCLMHPLFAAVNHATVRVLTRNGCEVITPPEQLGCGALHVHNGRREEGIQLARHNVAVFLAAEPLDAIVTNSAGCGATLKEYAALLAEDGNASSLGNRFTALVRDVSEWLAQIELVPPEHPVPLRVAYDDPCHLLHAQGIGAAPRKLLGLIPELELVPLPESDWCCGSAGIYNIVQPELSDRILARKIEQVRRVSPDVLATANPGCLLQLEAGVRTAGLRIPVVHVMELLDWAYTGRRPTALRSGLGR